jgi:hypothetical protein
VPALEPRAKKLTNEPTRECVAIAPIGTCQVAVETPVDAEADVPTLKDRIAKARNHEPVLVEEIGGTLGIRSGKALGIFAVAGGVAE